MITKEFKSGAISATVREETVEDTMTKRRLLTKFYDPATPDETDRWYEFIDLLVQSSNVVGLPFSWPAVTAEEKELREARTAFLKLPGRVYRKWKDALSSVNADPDDEDLAPAEKVDPKGEATPPSQPSEPLSEPA
jgi:hypothetical protein